jgi:hypothetical protein
LTFLWSIRQSKQDFAVPNKTSTIRTMQYWRIGVLRTNLALRVTPIRVCDIANSAKQKFPVLNRFSLRLIGFPRRARLTFLWSFRQSKQDFAAPNKMWIIRTMQYWRIGVIRTNLALRVTPNGTWGFRNLWKTEC